ncbi:threonine ammonia-lyase [Natrinema longum]|uniref:Threonine/serine dehydratase n=1 Tax=Natrinema longum TaxID=370324 RepID=A0A8A2U9Y4_9EURY|nr:threonine/serine dehydratase [Natrinema longum]MBZ6493936.1 threonine/serine dehydratase [Natrinema longum]QSW84728.1 threonine/serine dehydratase [Natrinema longum]
MSYYDPVESPDETTVFPYHKLTPPTIADVFRARNRISQHLPKTPLIKSEALSAEFDADVYLKREDTLPTGAFKVRGGVNLLSTLDPDFHDPGVIAASTGNHGQSIAYAGRQFDVPVTIVVPEDANQAKVAAMERLGATVLFSGTDFDDSRVHAEELASEDGYRYVHSANEPALVAGVGTAGLEVAEELPDIDYLFCPVGGGSSASGYCLTVGALTDATVIGAQSEAAPAMYRAWANDHLEPHDRMETFAEGIATRVPFALTTRLLRDRLDDFRLVSEDAIRKGVGDLYRVERIPMEGACAASLAAMRQRADELSGSTVVFPISGRNIELEKLEALVAETV